MFLLTAMYHLYYKLKSKSDDTCIFLGTLPVLEKVDNFLKQRDKRSQFQLSRADLTTVENKMKILEFMIECFIDIKLQTIYQTEESVMYFKYLADFLSKGYMTDHFWTDIAREVKRLRRVLQFLQIKHSCNIREEIAQNLSVKSTYNATCKMLCDIGLYTDERDAELVATLRQLNVQLEAECEVAVEENIDVIVVFKMPVTSWL